MKRILAALVIAALSLAASAGENDSILLQKVDVLKKEIGHLQKQNRNLQAKLSRLQKSHRTDLDELNKKLDGTGEEIGKINTAVAGLDQSLKDSEEKSMASLTTLGDWTRKTILILAVITLVLLVVLLIFVLANRNRILKDYGKLEAKVDNTREAVEKEIKEVLRKHDEDISALKAKQDKGGK